MLKYKVIFKDGHSIEIDRDWRSVQLYLEKFIIGKVNDKKVYINIDDVSFIEEL